MTKGASNETDKFELIKKAHLDVIIRLAHINHDFRKLCKRTELVDPWKTLWYGYGMILSQIQGQEPVLLHPHPSLSPFTLLRGAYYFAFSLHALQRHNDYLKHKIECTSEASIKNQLYKKLIRNNSSKGLTHHGACHYGSYGYMM